MTLALPAQPMPTLSAQPRCRLPLGRLSVSLFVAAAVGAALAGGIAGLLTRTPWIGSAALAAGAVAAGTLAGLGLLAAMRPRSIGEWPLLFVVGSSVRMFAALAAALTLFFAFRPAVGPFWSAFLASSLAALATEVAVLRGAFPGSTASAGTQPESYRS